MTIPIPTTQSSDDWSQVSNEPLLEEEITDDLLRQALTDAVTEQMRFDGPRINAWHIQGSIFVRYGYLSGAVMLFICKALKKNLTTPQHLNLVTILQQRGMIKPLRHCILEYAGQWPANFGFTWLLEIPADRYWTDEANVPMPWTLHDVNDDRLRGLETLMDKAATGYHYPHPHLRLTVAYPTKLPPRHGPTAILPSPHIVIATYHGDPSLAPEWVSRSSDR
jgi:hypothetical protein